MAYVELLQDLIKLANRYSPSLADDDDIDENFRKSDISSISERNALYIMYIRNYTFSYNKRLKGQSKMKWIFFVVILFLLLSLVVGTAIAIWVAINKSETTINYNDIAIIVSSIAGVITSFIVLPKVIAKNLFPNTEDDHSAEIFKSVIENDMKLREFYNITKTKIANKEQAYNSKNFQEIDDDSM